MSRRENLLVALFATTFGLVFFDRIAISFLLPRIVTDLQLDGAQVGMLAGALGLCWALSSLFVPALAERLHVRVRTLVALICAFSVFTLLCGFATSFLWLLVLRGLVGLAQGPVLPLVQSMMAQASSPGRRGLNMGLLQNVGGSVLGNLAAPIVMAGLAALYGWRDAMVLIGLPGFVLAIVLALVLSEPSVPTPQDRQAGRQQLLTLLARRNVVLVILVGSLQLGCLVIVMTFTPLQLMRERGWSEAAMGGFMAVLGVAGLAWGIAIPWAADRWGRRPVMGWASMLGASLPLAIAFLPGTGWSLTMLAAVTFLTGPAIAIAVAVVTAESVPAGQVTAVAGIVMGLVELFGGFLAPVAAGHAHDAFGAAAPFVIAATLSLGAGLLCLLLVETLGRKGQST